MNLFDRLNLSKESLIELSNLSPYVILLQGKIYIPHICQILDDLDIEIITKSQTTYEYVLKTNLGKAIIIISGGETHLKQIAIEYPLESNITKINWDYTSQIEFKILISTPIEFINNVTALINRFAQVSQFSIKTSHPSRFPNNILKPLNDFALEEDYQETQQLWQQQIVLDCFFDNHPNLSQLNPDLIASPEQRFFHGITMRFLPLYLFLCPKKIQIQIVSDNGYLKLVAENASTPPILSDKMPLKIETDNLINCSILKIERKGEIIILEGENFKIPLKELSTKNDNQTILFTTLVDCQIVPNKNTIAHKYNRYIINMKSDITLSGDWVKVLQCMNAIAIQLDWKIIDGIKLKSLNTEDLKNKLENYSSEKNINLTPLLFLTDVLKN